MEHSLVIGGTGMLRNVCLHLADKGHIVSVVARSSHGFESLAGDAKLLAGKINPLQLDYCNGKNLRESIAQTIEDFGDICVAVTWIHSVAPDAPRIIAKAVSNHLPCLYFDIWGFATDDPFYIDRESKFRKMAQIDYRKITLGYVLEDGYSRWLTDEEISAGVIAAVDGDLDNYVVGRIEPRDARP